MVYNRRMTRTNIVLDDRLVRRVMRLYGLRTKREAIDFALRRTLAANDDSQADPHARALALEGGGWAGDLNALRDEPIVSL